MLFRFKYPFVSCEVFCCEVDALFSAILEVKEIKDKLFAFLEQPDPLPVLSAGYFAKVVGLLISKRTVEAMFYFQNNKEVLKRLVEHMSTTSLVVEVLMRVVSIHVALTPLLMPCGVK